MRMIFTGETAIAPPVGIEPTTYGLEVRRSIHLSYGSNLLAQIYRPLKSGEGVTCNQYLY